MVKYYGTKRTAALKRIDRAPMTALYMPMDWELEFGKYYEFTILRLEGEDTFSFTKRLTKVGKGAQQVIINSSFGIKPGEMIVFTVEEVISESD